MEEESYDFNADAAFGDVSNDYGTAPNNPADYQPDLTIPATPADTAQPLSPAQWDFNSRAANSDPTNPMSDTSDQTSENEATAPTDQYGNPVAGSSWFDSITNALGGVANNALNSAQQSLSNAVNQGIGTANATISNATTGTTAAKTTAPKTTVATPSSNTILVIGAVLLGVLFFWKFLKK